MSSPDEPSPARADEDDTSHFNAPVLDKGEVTSDVSAHVDALINAANDSPATDPNLPLSLILFNGDMGTLKLETRRCLVNLLTGPSVDGRRQPGPWAVLIRDQDILRSVLHNLFLDLVVDDAQQVAFIRQVPEDADLDFPILLRRQQLTLIESALVLYLRQRLTEADSANERAVVSVAEMTDHLAVFDKARNTDLARFDRQCAGAMDKCKTLNLIRPIRSSDGRFEISPTLKLLFTAEDILALTATYAKLKSEQPVSDDTSLDDAIARGIAEGEAELDSDEENP
jgi:hypothetical protein